MTIETAEKLKSELTDRYVVVEEGVLELRRFVGRTGFVKTVNMNGRAVVQFDSSEDIGWYDIDPSYLKVVDKPEPAPKKETVKETAKSTPAAKKESAAPAAKKKKSGMSPLELARQQGAGGKEDAAKPPQKKSAGLSPLEQARQQGAAGKTNAGKTNAEKTNAEKTSTAKTEATTKPKAKKPVAGGKKLSPLEMARMQDGGGAKTAESEISEPEPEPEAVEENTDSAKADSVNAETESAEEEKPRKSDAPTTSPDGKKLSPLELARRQGPFKG